MHFDCRSMNDMPIPERENAIIFLGIMPSFIIPYMSNTVNICRSYCLNFFI